MRIERGRPSHVSLVEPRSEPGNDGSGERDISSADAESSVGDVGRFQFPQILHSEPVESHECDGERGHRVRRGQRGGDGFDVDRQGDGGDS